MSKDKKKVKDTKPAEKNPVVATKKPKTVLKEIAKEIGGPEGPEPTRYGDWEKNGRCSDF
jgi:hypothetical protein